MSDTRPIRRQSTVSEGGIKRKKAKGNGKELKRTGSLSNVDFMAKRYNMQQQRRRRASVSTMDSLDEDMSLPGASPELEAVEGSPEVEFVTFDIDLPDVGEHSTENHGDVVGEVLSADGIEMIEGEEGDEKLIAASISGPDAESAIAPPAEEARHDAEADSIGSPKASPEIDCVNQVPQAEEAANTPHPHEIMPTNITSGEEEIQLPISEVSQHNVDGAMADNLEQPEVEKSSAGEAGNQEAKLGNEGGEKKDTSVENDTTLPRIGSAGIAPTTEEAEDPSGSGVKEMKKQTKRRMVSMKPGGSKRVSLPGIQGRQRRHTAHARREDESKEPETAHEKLAKATFLRANPHIFSPMLLARSGRERKDLEDHFKNDHHVKTRRAHLERLRKIKEGEMVRRRSLNSEELLREIDHLKKEMDAIKVQKSPTKRPQASSSKTTRREAAVEAPDEGIEGWARVGSSDSLVELPALNQDLLPPDVALKGEQHLVPEEEVSQDVHQEPAQRSPGAVSVTIEGSFESVDIETVTESRKPEAPQDDLEVEAPVLGLVEAAVEPGEVIADEEESPIDSEAGENEPHEIEVLPNLESAENEESDAGHEHAHESDEKGIVDDGSESGLSDGTDVALSPEEWDFMFRFEASEFVSQIISDTIDDEWTSAIDEYRDAVEQGVTSHAKKLITDKLGANAVEESTQTTALMMACKHGNQQLVKHLVRMGCNLDAKNHMGRTALHVCAEAEELEIARYLARHGADRSIRDKMHFTYCDVVTSAVTKERFRDFLMTVSSSTKSELAVALNSKPKTGVIVAPKKPKKAKKDMSRKEYIDHRLEKADFYDRRSQNMLHGADHRIRIMESRIKHVKKNLRKKLAGKKRLDDPRDNPVLQGKKMAKPVGERVGSVDVDITTKEKKRGNDSFTTFEPEQISTRSGWLESTRFSNEQYRPDSVSEKIRMDGISRSSVRTPNIATVSSTDEGIERPRSISPIRPISTSHGNKPKRGHIRWDYDALFSQNSESDVNFEEKRTRLSTPKTPYRLNPGMADDSDRMTPMSIVDRPLTTQTVYEGDEEHEDAEDSHEDIVPKCFPADLFSSAKPRKKKPVKTESPYGTMRLYDGDRKKYKMVPLMKNAGIKITKHQKPFDVAENRYKVDYNKLTDEAIRILSPKKTKRRQRRSPSPSMVVPPTSGTDFLPVIPSHSYSPPPSAPSKKQAKKRPKSRLSTTAPEISSVPALPSIGLSEGKENMAPQSNNYMELPGAKLLYRSLEIQGPKYKPKKSKPGPHNFNDIVAENTSYNPVFDFEKALPAFVKNQNVSYKDRQLLETNEAFDIRRISWQ